MMTGICRSCGQRVELYQPTGAHNVYRTVEHFGYIDIHGKWKCSGSFGPADRYEKKKTTDAEVPGDTVQR